MKQLNCSHYSSKHNIRISTRTYGGKMSSTFNHNILYGEAVKNQLCLRHHTSIKNWVASFKFRSMEKHEVRGPKAIYI